MHELATYCNSYEATELTNIKAYCANTITKITKDTEEVMTGIYNGYFIHRSKRATTGYHRLNRSPRNLPAVLSVIGKKLIRHAPEILLSAGIIYQMEELSKMELQNKVLEEKNKKVTGLIVDITKLEFKKINQEIEHLTKQQLEIKIIERINSFSTAIQTLGTSIQAKHQDVINLRPIKALELEVSSINQMIKNIAIPSMPNPADVFTIHIPTKHLENGMVQIHFTIPLTEKDNYMEYAVISAPSRDNKIQTTDGVRIVKHVAVNSKNTTMFATEEATLISTNIFKGVTKTELNDCWTAIFEGKNLDTCPRVTYNPESTRFISMAEDAAVIITKEGKPLEAICDKLEHKLLHRVSIVHFKNCVFFDDSTNQTIKLHRESNLSSNQN